MKCKMQKCMPCVTHTVFPAVLVLAAVLVLTLPLGCKSSIEGVTFLSGDFSSPQLQDLSVQSASTIELCFNKSVTLHDVTLVPKDSDEAADFSVSLAYADDGKSVTVVTEEALAIGSAYLMNCEVEDASGNTVTMTAQFKGFNDHPAYLALSELRIKNKNDTKAPEKSKSEFVELYVLREGNLSGLELVNADNGTDCRYEFPAIEVKKGEYIVVHYRKLLGTNKDELGENLSEASGIDCEDGARDLFCTKVLSGTKGWLGTSDIVVVRNAERAQVQDAFLYSKDTSVPWKGDEFTALAAAVEESEIWRDEQKKATSAPESAFAAQKLNSDARSVARKNVETLSVDNFYNTASDWKENTKSKQQSPGKKNQ